jgi:hypothetical protein
MTAKSGRDKTSFAEQWADAPTLDEYMNECAAHLRDAQRSAERTRQPTSEVTPLQGAVLSLQEHSAMRTALKAAMRKICDDLVANRIACIGREKESDNLKHISASFWIGAKIRWDEDTAIRGTKEFVDLRVVTDTMLEPIEPEQRIKPGRPSRKDVILDAITQHAISDPGLMRPKRERFDAYRSYISDQGYDPHQDSGFSEKTLEKFETKFRRKSK